VEASATEGQERVKGERDAELVERVWRAIDHAAMGGLDGFWADGDGEREEHIGTAALAALGLDDLDAFATAVGRAAWVRQHELGHRLPPLAIDDIVRTGLEAALTPPKKP
jgi:hypothetical protein